VHGTNILEVKTIFYDEKKNSGIVKGNVRITSTKDSLVIEGDEAHYYGQRGISKIWGHALMKSFGDGDTLFLSADTLISYENKVEKKKMLYAYHHVKLYRTDLQGKCDSLLYNFADSTIEFVGDPVLWNEDSQIEADSMKILMSQNKISKMFMTMNSFIISEDTLKNFNQVKGRNMTAYFNDNKIQTVYVDGNGESIYFALEENKKVVGMNKTLCSNMVIRFSNNTLNSISFINQPDAKFIPPGQLSEPDKRLKGFSWRFSEKPSKAEVIHQN
jgi:lipopolysaccharide export system protein LptA